MKMKPLLLAIFPIILTACSAGSGGGDTPIPYENQKGEKRVKAQAEVLVIGDLNKSEEFNKLLEAIQKRDPKDNLTTYKIDPKHRKSIPEGSVVGYYKQSYASFVAIRQIEEGKEIDDIPNNRFVAIAHLPTTDRNVIVDATYQGKVGFSRQNNGGIVTHDLTMRVKNNEISGSVERMKAKKPETLITFKPAEIQAAADRISFSGEAVFHKSFFAAGKENDIAGRYNGLFAGEKGEELIGTFHSNSTDKENSVQGAMSATRQ